MQVLRRVVPRTAKLLSTTSNSTSAGAPCGLDAVRTVQMSRKVAVATHIRGVCIFSAQQEDDSERRQSSRADKQLRDARETKPVSYTHLRAHETDSYLVC